MSGVPASFGAAIMCGGVAGGCAAAGCPVAAWLLAVPGAGLLILSACLWLRAMGAPWVADAAVVPVVLSGLAAWMWASGGPWMGVPLGVLAVAAWAEVGRRAWRVVRAVRLMGWGRLSRAERKALDEGASWQEEGDSR